MNTPRTRLFLVILPALAAMSLAGCPLVKSVSDAASATANSMFHSGSDSPASTAPSSAPSTAKPSPSANPSGKTSSIQFATPSSDLSDYGPGNARACYYMPKHGWHKVVRATNSEGQPSQFDIRQTVTKTKPVMVKDSKHDVVIPETKAWIKTEFTTHHHDVNLVATNNSVVVYNPRDYSARTVFHSKTKVGMYSPVGMIHIHTSQSGRGKMLKNARDWKQRTSYDLNPGEYYRIVTTSNGGSGKTSATMGGIHTQSGGKIAPGAGHEKVTYLGRQVVTVPAGKFNSCVFHAVETDSEGSSNIWYWINVGTGMPLKTLVFDGGSVGKTAMISGSVDGVSLTPINPADSDH